MAASRTLLEHQPGRRLPAFKAMSRSTCLVRAGADVVAAITSEPQRGVYLAAQLRLRFIGWQVSIDDALQELDRLGYSPQQAHGLVLEWMRVQP